MLTAINTTYQFTTAGDYVNFYVNNNLVFKLSKDSNIVAWYFDDEPGIVFKVNGGTYFTGQPEDISFDGVPLGSKEGFVTAIKAMFPVYAGGGGGGINPLLPVTGTGTATGDSTAELAGKKVLVQNGGDPLFFIDPANKAAYLATLNSIGAGNAVYFSQDALDTEARIMLAAYFNGASNVASIQAVVNAISKILTYTADNHTFAGTFVEVQQLLKAQAVEITNNVDGGKIYIKSPDGSSFIISVSDLGVLIVTPD